MKTLIAGILAALASVSLPAADTATAKAGQTVTFSAMADGATPIKFQWRKNGQAISASPDSATLTLMNVGPLDAGTYDAVASNSAGVTTSNAIELTISSPATNAKITAVITDPSPAGLPQRPRTP